jgi:hypothetical protein
MSPKRWQQIERLYHEALERELPQRTAFLAEACADDDALRQEVESLLAQERSSSSDMREGAVRSPLERPAWDGDSAPTSSRRRLAKAEWVLYIEAGTRDSTGS